MARWAVLLCAGCVQTLVSDVCAPILVEEPRAARRVEECPVTRPGPTFSSAGEPPCEAEGQRCYYGAMVCLCRRRDHFARWICATDDCLEPSGRCVPGTKCDFGFEDTQICSSNHAWISVTRVRATP
jgi:hypothetical protein